ncbi:MAG TPA: hypothetical protein VK766_08325, partial [Cytophagaceae bacterium]|nr:hypothetical protein [Cytophagaceae bacterium]
MDWAFYFSFFCAIHLDLIALLLWMVSSKNRSNLYLAVFIFLFSSIHWQNAILLGGYIGEFPYIDPLCGILLSLCGPFFLFYIRSITATKVFSSPADLFHLAPSLISVLHFLRTLGWTREEFYNFYYAAQNRYTPENKFMLFLMIGYFLLYLVWGLYLIRNYSDKIQQFASNLDKIQLNWLKYTLYIFIFLAVVLAPLFLLIGKINYMVVAMMYFTTFLYLWIVYRSMNHSPLFINEMASMLQSSKEKSGEKEEITEPSRYQNSSLNAEKLQAYYQPLEQYLVTQKPYLNPELSLKMLSDQTG